MTRRRLAALLAAVALALPFLLAGDARAETPPADGLTGETVDLGNGWGQTVWRDAAGDAYDLGLVVRLPGGAVGSASSGGDVPALIRGAAPRYGLDTERMLRVAWCESKYQPGAVGDHGAARGVYQFHPALWSTTPQGRAGLSRDDPAANVEAAMWAWSHGYRSHWSCQG